MRRSFRLLLRAVIVATASSLTGCAGPAPRLFPVAPVKAQVDPDSVTRREYDTDGDRESDFIEALGNDGRITELRSRDRGAGWTILDWKPSGVGDRRSVRQLLVIVDSVPYHMVREAWEAGRFRLFHPPVRTIAPYPVMTDLSLAEFFGCSPCPGVESAYYDGVVLHDGYDTYVHGGNVPWHKYVDYWMNTTAHAFAYLWPDAWFDHELRCIQDEFIASKERQFAGYCVSTSALGAQYGRDGHARALVRLDRFCQWVVRRERGRVDITLMSDHGHNLMKSSRIPLPETLSRMGYNVTNKLRAPADVVVPEFGVVTCAAVSTLTPDRLSRDVVSIEGIRLASYLDESRDEVVVIGRDGEARIGRDATGRFSYNAARGDPLQSMKVFAQLASASQAGERIFLDEAALKAATVTHDYPDAIHRIWRTFHGLIEHAPTVLIDVEDGYHCGSPFMSKLVDLAAAHGNLGQLSSSGFCMTTAGALPQDQRMQEIAANLEALGFHVRSGKLVTHK